MDLHAMDTPRPNVIMRPVRADDPHTARHAGRGHAPGPHRDAHHGAGGAGRGPHGDSVLLQPPACRGKPPKAAGSTRGGSRHTAMVFGPHLPLESEVIMSRLPEVPCFL